MSAMKTDPHGHRLDWIGAAVCAGVAWLCTSSVSILVATLGVMLFGALAAGFTLSWLRTWPDRVRNFAHGLFGMLTLLFLYAISGFYR